MGHSRGLPIDLVQAGAFPVQAGAFPVQAGAFIGGLLLIYVVASKVGAIRFRRRAGVVAGRVLKVFQHGRFTSYFVAYTLGGTERVAEYRGRALSPTLVPGEVVEIRVDLANPPNAPLPEGVHVATGASGQVELASTPLFSFWDVAYLALATWLIVRAAV